MSDILLLTAWSVMGVLLLLWYRREKHRIKHQGIMNRASANALFYVSIKKLYLAKRSY